MALFDVNTIASGGVAVAEDYETMTSVAHAHSCHQLLFALRGTMQLVVEGRRWLLPPQRAAWISAHVTHHVSSQAGVSLRTVYLHPSLVLARDLPGCRVFAIPPLGQEMLRFAMRWSTTENAEDPVRTPFFLALAALAEEWMGAPLTHHLPEPNTPALGRATRYVLENPSDATPEGAAKSAGMSLRTLGRRFETELGRTFREYRQTARMLDAMERLALPEASVGATAVDVGFATIASFSGAFKLFTGETPTQFQARVRHGSTEASGGPAAEEQGGSKRRHA